MKSEGLKVALWLAEDVVLELAPHLLALIEMYVKTIFCDF